jgi:hypothetical protein
MKIIIPIYRDIAWILPIYFYLHKKYWGEEILLLGEEHYIKDDAICKSVAMQWVNHETTPSDYFSNCLLIALNQMDDNQVIIMLPDYLLTKEVDSAIIYKMQDYMSSNVDVLRCQLGTYTISNSKLFIEKYKNIDIYERGFHPTNLTPGIWNRKLLIELLGDRWTAWDVENKCQDKFLMSNMRSICPVPEPIDYINGIRSRNNNTLVVNNKVFEEIQHLIPKNIAIWKTETV